MLIKFKGPVADRQRSKRGTDYYSDVLRAQPKIVDVYQRPGMGDLGDLSGTTGIPAIDGAVDAVSGKIDQAAFALKLSTVCAVAGLAVSLVTLWKSR